MSHHTKDFQEKNSTLNTESNTINKKTKFKLLKKIWNHIEGINGFLIIIYSIFIFSTAAITSEHFSKLYFAITMMFIVILSVIICPRIIRFLSKFSISCYEKEQSVILKNPKIVKLSFYIIPLIFFLVYYAAYYPGGFSPDSIEQYQQVINNNYNDWHPVIQTLFAFTLPLTLAGGWIGAIALFQIICLSAVLGYSFNTIFKYTNFKYTIISMAFILLNPQLGHIAMFPWKDMSFAIGALLLLTYALKIYITKGEWIKSSLNTTLFIVTAALTTLFRHNGLLFTIPLIFAVLFYLTKKRGIIICLSIIMLCFGIKVPLYSIMNVEKPDKRQVETLGLPMTVIGAVITYTPEALDEETRDFAYKVAPKEVWSENYCNGSYNSVKWNEKTNNNIIEEYGSQKVLSMMFRCFKNSKKVSLTSLIKLTEASYTVSDDYNSITLPSVYENDFNIQQSGNYTLKLLTKGYSNFVSQNFNHVFMRLGVMHLLLIISILAKCKFKKLKDWKKIFFIIPVFAYNYGTTLLLTGIGDSTRFFFYTFPLIPILLIFLFREENERRTDDVIVRT